MDKRNFGKTKLEKINEYSDKEQKFRELYPDLYDQYGYVNEEEVDEEDNFTEEKKKIPVPQKTEEKIIPSFSNDNLDEILNENNRIDQKKRNLYHQDPHEKYTENVNENKEEKKIPQNITDDFKEDLKLEFKLKEYNLKDIKNIKFDKILFDDPEFYDEKANSQKYLAYSFFTKIKKYFETSKGYTAQYYYNQNFDKKIILKMQINFLKENKKILLIDYPNKNFKDIKNKLNEIFMTEIDEYVINLENDDRNDEKNKEGPDNIAKKYINSNNFLNFEYEINKLYNFCNIYFIIPKNYYCKNFIAFLQDNNIADDIKKDTIKNIENKIIRLQNYGIVINSFDDIQIISDDGQNYDFRIKHFLFSFTKNDTSNFFVYLAPHKFNTWNYYIDLNTFYSRNGINILEFVQKQNAKEINELFLSYRKKISNKNVAEFLDIEQKIYDNSQKYLNYKLYNYIKIGNLQQKLNYILKDNTQIADVLLNFYNFNNFNKKIYEKIDEELKNDKMHYSELIKWIFYKEINGKDKISNQDIPQISQYNLDSNFIVLKKETIDKYFGNICPNQKHLTYAKCDISVQYSYLFFQKNYIITENILYDEGTMNTKYKNIKKDKEIIFNQDFDYTIRTPMHIPPTSQIKLIVG